MRLTKYIPSPFVKTAKVYLWGLCIFSVFRLMLFINERNRIGSTENLPTIVESFIMGLRFDTVILCYILALPFLVLTISYFLNRFQRFSNLFFKYFISVTLSIAFVISAADIPYFKHFFSRLSISALEWMDSPSFVFGMIAEEPLYWLFILPTILILWFIIRKVSKISQMYAPRTSLHLSILFTLLGAFLLFAGIRGRLAHKSPIRVGTAYFNQSAFLNQLGLNANFTFLKSYLQSQKSENKAIQFMDTEQAISLTQKYLNIDDTKDGISREYMADSSSSKMKNVVLIIMESMSASKLTRHGNSNELTPFLDSLTYEGAYYPNAYAAGIHTFNGIFSSIFSLPAIYRRHPMKGASIKEFDGLFEYTKKKDYQTIYFCTHDGQFDNVEGFLTANYCDEVIASDDYPSEEIKTTLGVPDDYMFRSATKKLNELSNNSKPFAATIMTASDHGPYYVPLYFTPKNSETKKQIVEYADWSLRQFFESASKQSWYDSTLFVLVADHGAAMNASYDMPLSYNHTPLLFYSPHNIYPSINKEMAGQIDIFPTIMDYLNLPFVNKTLGINLNDSFDRPFIYFNGDDKYGVINQEWFLIQKQDGFSGLYKYREKDLNNYAEGNVSKIDSMRQYAEAQLQTYQHLINN